MLRRKKTKEKGKMKTHRRGFQWAGLLSAGYAARGIRRGTRCIGLARWPPSAQRPVSLHPLRFPNFPNRELGRLAPCSDQIADWHAAPLHSTSSEASGSVRSPHRIFGVYSCSLFASISSRYWAICSVVSLAPAVL